MKIQQRNTAVQSFYDLKDLPSKRKAVYEAIAFLGKACNLDIAYKLQQPINRITPRTNELVKLGLVEEAERAITPRTGRRVIYWKVVQSGQQQTLL